MSRRRAHLATILLATLPACTSGSTLSYDTWGDQTWNDTGRAEPFDWQPVPTPRELLARGLLDLETVCGAGVEVVLERGLEERQQVWPSLHQRSLDLWVRDGKLTGYFLDYSTQDGTPDDRPTLLRSDTYDTFRLVPGLLGEPEGRDPAEPATAAIELGLIERPTSETFRIAAVVVEPRFSRPELTLAQQLAALGVRADELRLLGTDPWLGAFYECVAFAPADADDPSRAGLVISSPALGQRQVTALVVIRDDGDALWSRSLFDPPGDVGENKVDRRVGRDRLARFQRWEQVTKRAEELRLSGHTPELLLPWLVPAAFGEDRDLLGVTSDAAALAARRESLARRLAAPPGEPESLLALVHEVDLVDSAGGGDANQPLVAAHREALAAHASASAVAAAGRGLFATALTFEWLHQELLPLERRDDGALVARFDAVLASGRVGAVTGMKLFDDQLGAADLLARSPAGRVLGRALRGSELAALPGVPTWRRVARDQVQLDLDEGRGSEVVSYFVPNPDWEAWAKAHGSIEAYVARYRGEARRWEEEYVPPDPWRSRYYRPNVLEGEWVGSVFVEVPTPDLPAPAPRPQNPHQAAVDLWEAEAARHLLTEPSRGDKLTATIDYRYQRWRGTFVREHSLQDAEGRELAMQRVPLTISLERRSEPAHAPSGRPARNDFSTRAEVVTGYEGAADTYLATDATEGWRKLVALALPGVMARALPDASEEERARELALTRAWLGHPDRAALARYSDLFASLAMEPVPLLRSGAPSCLADGLRPDLPTYSFP